MKFKFFIQIVIISLIAMVSMSLMVTVFAETTATDGDVTTAPTYATTEPTTAQTYATTEPTTAQTYATTEPTTAQTYATTAPTTAQTYATTEPTTAQTYATTAPTNATTLPTVDNSDITVPTAVASEVEGEGISLVSGIIVWLCVAVGVAVILAVMFSTKARKKGGIDRYESGNKMNRKGKKLRDIYYDR